MVLTDRDPLALRCALRSARRTGLMDVQSRPCRLEDAQNSQHQVMDVWLNLLHHARSSYPGAG